jgi:flagellar biosynthesis/type III secretory pathway M-ring protein FliF/YscJ
MPTDPVSAVIFSIAPTLLIGLVFWFIMRAIIRSDHNERSAYSKVEAEERAKFEAEREAATPEV